MQEETSGRSVDPRDPAHMPSPETVDDSGQAPETSQPEENNEGSENSEEDSS